MGYTGTRFGDIINDLKSSNFFRIWAVLWLLCALLTFSCLVILGGRSQKAGNTKDIIVHWSNVSSMYLPRFHFHTDGIDVITNMSCAIRGDPVPSGPCAPYPGQPTPSLQQCIAVYADQIEVFNNVADRFGLGVDCNITTVGFDPLVGSMVGWNFDGWQGFFAGPDARFSTWIHATYGSFILLGKGVITINKQFQVDEWTRQLQYLTTASTPGSFRVFVVLEGFGVLNFAPRNIYDGWKAVGDVGGFAFFMFGLHTLVMIIVGLVFVNNSSFLKPKESSSVGRSEYVPVRE